MSEWIETTLSEISEEITYGYTASAATKPIGPKFLRITDIVPDRINWDTVPYCDADKKVIEKYKLYDGDIIVARTGATTGYNKIIKHLPHEAVFASYLIRFKINKEKAFPDYIGHILTSNDWYSYVQAISGGSAQPGANAKLLGSFPIPLPPLPEQKTIAGVLSSLDDKIDLLHRQNKTLEAMAETLFRQWFIEEAEDDWEEYTISQISTIRAGGDKPKVFSEKKTALCRIPIYSNGILNQGLYGYTDFAVIEKESVTISARGTIGFVCLRQEPYVPIVRLVSIIPDERYITSKYLFLWAKSLNISGTGTTQQQLTVPDFKNTKLKIPPYKIMYEFTEDVNLLFKKVRFNNEQIRTLSFKRDSLLPKLMSGEVRVEYE